MVTLGFIGMGNMGSALLKGTKKVFGNDIVFHDGSDKRMEEISTQEEVKALKTNSDVVRDAKYVILAIKPQVFDKVYGDINEALTDENIIISLAPGITVEQLRSKINTERIVRTMPNTPAMVGEGMTGICYDEKLFTTEEEEVINKIFSSVGRVKKVDENLINSVVCASGSSPAYVFMFMEALADSVVSCGMPRNDAYEFVAQAVLGSARLMLETGMHPGQLKDMVSSPGGTTIAGVSELEKNGFRKAIFAATEACFNKCNNIK